MPDRKPGIYRDISNSEYHIGEGLGASHLRELLRSPLHYITRVNTPKDYVNAVKALYDYVILGKENRP